MTDSKFLKFSVENTIGHLAINRPPVNALGRQLIQHLHDFSIKLNKAVDSGRQDIRALIISAEGRHFCAGADLKERQGMLENEVEKIVTATREMTNAIASINIPVIAAVHGSALGGGMELALAADLRILAESAKMGLRETALAIIPGAGGTQRLPRLIGASNALYWITSAKIFSAQECLQYGAANWLAPDSELLPKAREIAGEIAA
ncbi:MAG: enoyl-CoA hydratase/isomerase family protein, partial [bacterium]